MTKRQYSRLYLGYRADGTSTRFRSKVTPTAQTHPHYTHVVGPFRTKAGADLMAGPHGPLISTVNDAETQARKMREATA